jgi:hypothetical protein
MALIAMLILAVLLLAFLSLSGSEPQIAANHLRMAQARALAEAGIDRTIWGLTNPTDSAGLATPLPTTASALAALPTVYTGSPVTLGSGQYTLSLANGATSNEISATSTGWVPDSTNPKAKRVVTATLSSLRNFNLDLPCALCVKGDLDVDGNASVDARPSSACTAKVGTYTSGDTHGFGQGHRDVYGADGNNTPNQSTDYTENAAASTFDAFTLSSDELNILKSIARANNTYYQGSVSFGSSNPLPNGVVFVDTVSGNNITSSTSTSDYADVAITGADASGWLIVNGSLTIHGNVTYRGLVYVVDDFTYHGTGTGGISGAVVALGTAGSESEISGNSNITYDCGYVQNGNDTVPTGWFVKPGSWREVEG